MKRFILLVLLVAPFFVCAQDQDSIATKSRLEGFLEKSIFYKREFAEVGQVHRMTISSILITDMVKDVSLKGAFLSTLITETYSTSGDTRTAFFDTEEISDIEKSILFLNEKVLSTPVEQVVGDVEYHIQTKGEVEITVFNNKKKWEVQVKFKRYVRNNKVSITPLELLSLMDLLKEANKRNP